MGGIRPDVDPRMLAQPSDPFSALDHYDPFSALDSYQPTEDHGVAVAPPLTRAQQIAKSLGGSVKTSLSQLGHLATHPWEIPVGVAKDFMDTEFTPVQGTTKPTTPGRGGWAGGIRPADAGAVITPENTPGSITPEEQKKATLNTAVNVGTAGMGPFLGPVGHHLLGAGIGSYYSPDDRLAGALTGVVAGKAIDVGGKAVAGISRYAKAFNQGMGERGGQVGTPTDVAPSVELPQPPPHVAPETPITMNPVGVVKDTWNMLTRDRRTGNGALPDDVPTDRRTPSQPVEAPAEPTPPPIADPWKPLDTYQPRITGHDGTDTKVLLRDGQSLGARYRVVEGDDLQSSHDPFSFQPNAAYPEGVQGRDYARNKGAQEAVQRHALDFNPDLALNPSHSAGEGPPTVLPNGTVLAGNERSMLPRLASVLSPDKYAEYRTRLQDLAPQLGIDPQSVAGMKQPVLVRELSSDVASAGPERWAEINRLSDESVTKAKSAIEEGAGRSQVLAKNPDIMQHFEATFDPESTVPEYLGTPAGKVFVKALVNSGVITAEEFGRMADANGNLTEDGRNAVQRTILGTVVAPDALADAPRALVNKLSAVAPQILRAGGDFDLRPTLADALRIVADAKNKGLTVADLRSQFDLSGNAVEPKAGAMAEALTSIPRNKLREMFRQYATAQEEHAANTQSVDMFGGSGVTPDNAFKRIFAPNDPVYTVGMGQGKKMVEPSLFGPEPGQVEQTGMNLGSEPKGLTAETARRIAKDPREIYAASQGRASQPFKDATAYLNSQGKIGAEELKMRGDEVSGELPQSHPQAPGQQDVFTMGMGQGKRAVPPVEPPVVSPPLNATPGTPKLLPSDAAAIHPAEGLTIDKLPAAPGLDADQAKPLMQRLQEAKQGLKAVFAPRTLGEMADQSGLRIRAANAEKVRAVFRAAKTTEVFRDFIDKLSDEQKMGLLDAAEHGRESGSPALDQHQAVLRDLLDHVTGELQQRDLLHQAIENYIGRVTIKEPAEAAGRVGELASKRPMMGSQSFAEARTFPSAVDVVNAGYKLADYNYVTVQMAKLTEAYHAIEMHNLLESERAQGGAKKVLDMVGDKPPEGWVRAPDDPAFTVYGPREIGVEHAEAYDYHTRKALNDTMDRLGVTSGDVVKFPRSPKKWGEAYSTGDRVNRRIGGENSVLMHELGHALDFQYGLGDKLFNPQQFEPRPRAKGEREIPASAKTRIAITKESRALADLRYEGVDKQDVPKHYQQYVRNREEQVANALHAYVMAPDRMKAVAPTLYDRLDSFVRSNPKLESLVDLKPSLRLGSNRMTEQVPVAGLRIMGHWYMHPDVAPVYHNYLSKGMSGTKLAPVFHAAMTLGDMSKQAILGLSGFHLTTTAFNAAASEMARAAELAAHGHLKESAVALARSPLAPFLYAWEGREGFSMGGKQLWGPGKAMTAYLDQNVGGISGRVVDAMVGGGHTEGRPSEIWKGDRWDRFTKSLGQTLGNDPNVSPSGKTAARMAIRALPALMEKASSPIFKAYVPAIKRGIEYRMVADRLRELGPNVTDDIAFKHAAEISDEMDRRFGQIQYDNYFTNKMVKDVAQLVMLAPGWTWGTASALGRGITQTGTTPFRAYKALKSGEAPMMPHSMTFALSALAGTAMLGAITTYLATGKPPQEPKDLLFPPDGTLDANGNKNRIRFGGNYVQGDWHNALKDVVHPNPMKFAQDMVQMGRNKLSPPLSALAEFAANRNHWGDEVVDPEASAGKQGLQLAKHVGEKSFLPISVSNFKEAMSRGGEQTGPQLLKGFFGINPAARDVIRSDAENAMQQAKTNQREGVLTPDQAAHLQEQQKAKQAVRSGQPFPSGVLSPKQVHDNIGQKATTRQRFIDDFKRLAEYDAAQRVYTAATPEQRSWIAPAWQQKQQKHQRQQVGHP